MAATKLEPRADRLFGRETDLRKLRERASRTGLTVIIGPPQIGKSWLLMELARQLDRGTTPNSLVGFTRSPRGAPDPLLQVVSDLYQRWLMDSSSWAQLKMVWDQQKDTLLPSFARFVGKLAEKSAKLLAGFGELAGTAIKESMASLVVASEDLANGGIVPRLEYAQAQELVHSVHDISGRRVALVMDQWEETRDLDLQRNLFRDFLREPDEWPDCHILVGAREGGDAENLLRDLHAEYPSDVCIFPLAEMSLSDTAEQRRLLSFLRAQPQLRALENVPDQRVLNLIGGYPRVINRWTAEDAHETARTFQGLEQLAKDANEFRYRDLEKLLLDLDGDRRKLAVRIALAPIVEEADAWQALRPTILCDVDPNALDDLKLTNVFDKEAETPKFGHQTRRDAARAFLESRRREAVRAEAENLILRFGRGVDVFDSSTKYLAAALIGLRDTTVQLNLGPLPLALCEAAVRLFGKRPSSITSLIEGARQARKSREHDLRPILAGGILHSLTLAKEENLPCRDAFLNELRDLARDGPHNTVVREQLAEGLFSTLIDAKEEQDLPRRNALLDELRDLARDHSGDTGVQQALAKGLLNTSSYAREEQDLRRRDALLDELRNLARARPDNVGVREQLARTLLNISVDAKEEQDLPRRNALHDELRNLARDHPDDTGVRKQLALGLYNALNDAMKQKDFPRRDALLDELRDLARDFHDDAGVQYVMGMGLYNALNYAKEEEDLARRDTLLDELRDLAHDHPENIVACRQLARGLLNTLIDAREEQDFRRRDALLDELRDLARDYPDDTVERESLARALFDTLNDAKEKQNLARHSALFYELRHLARDHPDDTTMQKWRDFIKNF